MEYFGASLPKGFEVLYFPGPGDISLDLFRCRLTPKE